MNRADSRIPACLPVGREFVIWDFERYALCSMRLKVFGR
jgi:hypothetical protein